MRVNKKTLNLDENLYGYLLDQSLRDTSAQAGLRERTAAFSESIMQISPDQGQFLTFLMELICAKRILEVGTFTGYSALCMAQALPEDGELICCDISEKWPAIGRPFWRQAGVEDKITLRVAPALETLDALLTEGEAGHFDAAFIDADKPNYKHYYERCLELLRPGGLLMFDNVLWGGDVAREEVQDEDTKALRALNEQLHADTRVSISMVPIGDGLTLARKR